MSFPPDPALIARLSHGELSFAVVQDGKVVHECMGRGIAPALDALDRLPERCREVFIRLREEKQSYAQVAEELNISTKTVDAQLQKALTRLKEALLTE